MITNLGQYESLAAASANKTAEVAATASAAIRELAEAINGGSDTIVITCSTTEPDDDSYWFYIEEVEDE